MNKVIVALLTAVLIGIAYLFGDRVIFAVDKTVITDLCDSFESTVLVIGSMENGKYFSGNGVYLGDGVVLTAKHLLANNVIVEGQSPEKVYFHDDLDLAIVQLQNSITISPATIASDTSGSSFSVSYREGDKNKFAFAGTRLSVVNYDQFFGLHSPDSMIRVRNESTEEGYSGGALLNQQCEVVGLVAGGNRSFILGLRPNSYFVNLTNKDAGAWIEEKVAELSKVK